MFFVYLICLCIYVSKADLALEGICKRSMGDNLEGSQALVRTCMIHVSEVHLNRQ